MKKIILIAVVCAFVSAPALADLGIITVDYDKVTPKMDIPSKDIRPGVSASGTFHTGVYNLYLSGATAYGGVLTGKFQSFCIDMDDESTGTPQTYAIKTLNETPDGTAGPMQDLRARLVAELLDENWAWGTTITDSQTAAAMQLAVWEIVAETPGNYDLSQNAGNFFINAAETSYVAVRNQAETMLGNLSGTGHDYINRYVGLSHPISGTDQFQDFVVRVPVPGAVLLGAIGLIAAGRKLRKLA